MEGQLQREKQKLGINAHDLLEVFDIYTILNKLYYCCFSWNNANIIVEEKNETLVQELITTIQTKSLDQIPLVNLYYLILLLLMKPDEESNFFKLKKLLKSNTLSIGKHELRTIYTAASNYCNQKASKGQLHFHEEMFDLYNMMLEQKLLHKGKYIPNGYIKNLVSLGLYLDKYQWIKKFIEKIQNETLPKYRQSVYAFNKGALYFYTQRYNEALQVLLNVESIDVFYDLDYRSLLLKCYYELKETEPLLSLSEAFKKYVKQRKIADNQKKTYLNFIKYAIKLYKIKIQPRSSKAKITRIEQSIIENKAINNQRWLLEKVKEL